MRFQFPYEVEAFGMYADRLREQSESEPFTVELTRKRKQRTLKQNAYLHLILGVFAIETGYTETEAKTIFKQRNEAWFLYEKKGNHFWKSTRDLDSKEMTDCIDRFRSWSNENGVYLPSPDEDKMIEFYSNQIENQKRWI